MNLDTLITTGYIPHVVLRLGIRRQLRQRLATLTDASLTAAWERKAAYVAALRTRPMAVETAAANEQHYEVATSVFENTLGPRMKYSCCWFEEGAGKGSRGAQEELAQAEEEMLRLCGERAGLSGLKEGARILDLGCGWGSGGLYFAEKLPRCEVVCFSNSKTQKIFIEERARQKGLTNVTVITGNVVDYEFEADSFDRVISIELFEHMKNYELLMAKVARALKPGGKLFVHYFCHRDMPYDFDEGWMTTYFFTGGTMPSADLLHFFQRDLTLDQQWWVNGKHYSRTAEHWLANMAKHKSKLWPGLVETYGEANANLWYHRWEIFYLAVSELFAWGGGDTWGVAHYLFEKSDTQKA